MEKILKKYLFLIIIFVSLINFNIFCDLNKTNTNLVCSKDPLNILIVLLNKSDLKNNKNINKNNLANNLESKDPESKSIKAEDLELIELSKIIKSCLELSGQCAVTIRQGDAPKTNAEIKNFKNEGFPFVLFIRAIKNNGTNISSNISKHISSENNLDANLSKPADIDLDIRLYDTCEGLMLKGKRLAGLNLSSTKDKPINGFYKFLQELWSDLMGEKGPYNSLIAYIKREKNSNNSTISSFYLCSPDGLYHKKIMDLPGAYVGLYWHPSEQRLYCSEFARYNVRLISFDLLGKKNIILDKAGTSAGISFDKSASNKAVYCRSGDLWLYEHDPKLKKGIHKKIISNDGKNMYPILLSNGDIIFGSDSQTLKANAQAKNTKPILNTKSPAIYRYIAKDKSVIPLVIDGYALAPAYCQATGDLAYVKKVNGVLQIFKYNTKNGQTQQITSDAGNKSDPCWSFCGNYLVFCHQMGKNSRIAFINTNIGKRKYITSPGEYCLSPSWSNEFVSEL